LLFGVVAEALTYGRLKHLSESAYSH
jgi:hypothetical protein